MNAGTRLPAEVRFDNAPAALDAATQALRAAAAADSAPAGGTSAKGAANQPVSRTVRFDLSDCEQFDSSLVAVLIELLRRASAQGVACRFDFPPRKLLDLVALYGVETLLFGPESAADSADAR